MKKPIIYRTTDNQAAQHRARPRLLEAADIVAQYRQHNPDILNEWHRSKLTGCIKHARECSRNSWQEPKHHRREYLRMRREAMQDARYWRDLVNSTHERHTAAATGETYP